MAEGYADSHLLLANRSIFAGGHKLCYVYSNYIHAHYRTTFGLCNEVQVNKQDSSEGQTIQR